jgi:hypothetical protein
LDEGVVWTTATLPWSAVDAIEKALEIQKDMKSHIGGRAEVLVKLSSEFVVKFKLDGVEVSYTDYYETPELDEFAKEPSVEVQAAAMDIVLRGKLKSNEEESK